MNRRIFAALAACVALAWMQELPAQTPGKAPVRAAPTIAKRLFVSGGAGGIAEMQAPANWEMAGRSTPISIRLKAPDAPDKLLVTAFPLPKERQGLMTDDKMQEMLRASGASIVAGSVEGAVEVQSLSAAGGKAYYFVLSDKKLAGKPGGGDDFPFLHSGIVRFGNWAGTFSILSNEKEGAFVKQAMAAVASLRWADTAAADRAAAKGLAAARLAAPYPDGLQAKNEVLCVSAQAHILYSKFNELYAPLLGTRTVKTTFDSLDDGKGELGSVLYMEFDAPLKPEARSFIAGLLWGEEFPTRMHPEEFFTAGNQLVIWCTRTDSRIKRLSQARLEAALFPKK